MQKLVWIENNLTFKITRVYITQYLCVCSSSYKEELGLEIGDIIFLKDETKQKSFKRIGTIKAFGEPNKVIVGIMSDIGVGTKSKMEKLHNKSLEKEVSDDKI